MAERTVLYHGKPAIWPLPNSCEWKEGFYKLPDVASLSCCREFIEESELFAKSLAGLGIQAGFTPGKAHICVVKTDDGSIAEEGYALDVSPSGIVLKAASGKGMFYAFQSLLQLITNSTHKEIPAVSIADEPFKQVRGVHIYVPPRKELGWFKRYLDFLAKYKFNTIYLEIGAAMRFDSHPEINEAWESFCKDMLAYPGGPDSNRWGDNGMQMLEGNIKNSVHIENGGGSCIEKAEMAELADYCRRRHIEIIPEVQSMAHTYWMLLAHPECAERSDDRYPDTWCPSNPRSYEIYFDCLQEIVDTIKPKTVSMGNDEYHWIGVCDKCRSRTGHDLLAGHVNKIYDWVTSRGYRLFVWGDRFLHTKVTSELETGMHIGAENLWFNMRNRKPELVKATFRAADMIPNDIFIGDWYYTLAGGDGQETQDYFAMRSMPVVLGNFFVCGHTDIESRLRRPNVIGAEVSLWHETSELGMAMVDAVAKYLTAINVLWHRGWRRSMSGEYNCLVARIYPAERDRMNQVFPVSALSGQYEYIDISDLYNAPLNRFSDYQFVADSERLHNAIPFEVCKNVVNTDADPACVYIGQGSAGSLSFEVNGAYRSIAFLHSYTEHLDGPPAHACSYIGLEEDICGHYSVEYDDGTKEMVLLEYSRNIIATGSGYSFGAHRANPVYHECTIREEVLYLPTSKIVVQSENYSTLFGFEWENPYPGKRISRISVNHEPAKTGGILLFAVTGYK